MLRGLGEDLVDGLPAVEVVFVVDDRRIGEHLLDHRKEEDLRIPVARHLRVRPHEGGEERRRLEVGRGGHRRDRRAAPVGGHVLACLPLRDLGRAPLADALLHR